MTSVGRGIGGVGGKDPSQRGAAADVVVASSDPARQDKVGRDG